MNACGLVCNCGSEGNCLVHLRAVNHDLRERLATAEADLSAAKRRLIDTEAERDDFRRIAEPSLGPTVVEFGRSRIRELQGLWDEARRDVVRLDGLVHEYNDRWTAALADAAVLREQLGRVSNEVLRLTNQVAHLGMDLATAEALALTNGAERDELRGLLEKATAHVESACDIIEQDVPGMDDEDISEERAFIVTLRRALAARSAIPGEPNGANETKGTR